MTRYYFDKLNSNEKRFYEKVYSALVQRECSISAGLTIHEKSFERTIHGLSYDHPELFYVDFQHLSFMRTSLGLIYTPRYTVKTSIQSIISNQINDEINKILLAGKKAGLSTLYDYYRWIHNYLVKNVTYNYEAVCNPEQYPSAFSCCGALLNHEAVCEGISKAFKLICDRLNIFSAIVLGSSCLEQFNQEMAHAWNMVQIDDCFYHIDITWDINVSATVRYSRYDYFCIPDEAIIIDHNFEGYPQSKGYACCYFNQTHRLFSSVNQLKQHLENEIKNRSKVLYFRIVPGNSPPDSLHEKVQGLFDRLLSQNCTTAYSYQTAHNLKQHIFYYKINW